MKYFLYFFCMICFFSCINKKEIIKSNYETMTEVIYFDTKDFTNKESNKNSKYNLIKINLSDNNFDLYHNKHLILKSNEKDRNFIFEVFQSKYLFISHIPSNNKEASPFNLVRDTTFMYDMNSKMLYKFDTKKYLISPIKNSFPLINNDVSKNIRATMNDIDLVNKYVILLLSDLKTLHKIKLVEITNSKLIE